MAMRQAEHWQGLAGRSALGWRSSGCLPATPTCRMRRSARSCSCGCPPGGGPASGPARRGPRPSSSACSCLSAAACLASPSSSHRCALSISRSRNRAGSTAQSPVPQSSAPRPAGRAGGAARPAQRKACSGRRCRGGTHHGFGRGRAGGAGPGLRPLPFYAWKGTPARGPLSGRAWQGRAATHRCSQAGAGSSMPAAAAWRPAGEHTGADAARLSKLLLWARTRGGTGLTAAEHGRRAETGGLASGGPRPTNRGTMRAAHLALLVLRPGLGRACVPRCAAAPALPRHVPTVLGHGPRQQRRRVPGHPARQRRVQRPAASGGPAAAGG